MALSLTRTATDTGYRMVYPFLPAIARGLSVDLTTIAVIVSIRQSLGLLVPILGSVADHLGRKLTMLVGLGLYASAFLLIAQRPTLATFAIGLGVAAIAKAMLDPAVFAYLGDRVAQSRQSAAIAITEFSWSGSFLIGIPLVGWLIARSGWTAPFAVLAGSVIFGSLALWRVISPDPPPSEKRPTIFNSISQVVRRPSVVRLLAVGFLSSAGNGTVTIVYGAWIEDQFGLQVAALGLFSIVIGLAEFGGEGLVARVADRVNKLRAIGVGIGLNLLAALLLPLVGRTLLGAAMMLFAFYLSFEFALVCASPLLLELVPSARATTMASKTAVQRTGFAVGSLIGPFLFAGGIRANAMATAVLDMLALVTLGRYLMTKARTGIGP